MTLFALVVVIVGALLGWRVVKALRRLSNAGYFAPAATPRVKKCATRR